MKLVSTELRSFLTGLILGDGYIDKGVHKRAFVIKNTHEDFIRYIENTLRENTKFKITVKSYEATYIDNVYRQPYWELTISSHPYFAKRYHNFYNDYKQRRIPKETLSWLTPIGLANWYMSDGYIVRVGQTKGKILHRRVELATDRYTESDVKKIIEYLDSQYSIKATKIKRKDKVYRIRISIVSAQKFFLLIKDYVVDSYKYKLNLCYDYKPMWMCDDYYNLMNEICKCRPPELQNKVEGEDIV